MKLMCAIIFPNSVGVHNFFALKLKSCRVEGSHVEIAMEN